MSVELMSDLHLDLQKNMERVKFLIRKCLAVKTLELDRGVLLLPGDVASVHTLHGQKCWLEFLSTALVYYDYIIIVLGNHEHYSGDITTTHKLFQEKIVSNFEIQRIVVLENEIWTHPQTGIKIAGCTLWFFVPPDLHSLIKKEMNDYSYISNNSQPLTVSYTVELFIQSKKWLESIALNDMDIDIVLTHHAPLLNAGCSAPEHTIKGRPLSHAFESDLSSLVECFPVWCYGHTHHVTTLLIEESVVMSIPHCKVPTKIDL